MSLTFIDRNNNTHTIDKLENEERDRRFGKIDVTKLEYHKVTINTGVLPGRNKKIQSAEIFVNTTKPVLLHVSSDNIIIWKVTASPESDVPIVVTSGRLSKVHSVGKKYTRSCYLPHLRKSRESKLIEMLSTKPVSEQTFDKAGQAYIN